MLIGTIFLILISNITFCNAKTNTGTITPISIKELKAILDKDDSIILINALSPDVYEDCHIRAQGSINFPFYITGTALKQWEKDLIKKYPNAKKTPIYVYCTSPACAAGQMACKLLQKMGFKKIFEYKGGTREWFDTYGKDSCSGPCKAEYLFD
jgi:rhodanese-related sulfurtransferase